MDTVVVLVRVVLAGVFGLAAVTKLADLPGSRAAMRSFGVPERLAAPVGIGLPIAELTIAVLLLPLATAWWAAVVGLGLLLAFITGITYNLAQGRTPDCHCFGQVYSAPVGQSTLIRNGIFVALVSVLVLQGPNRQGSSLVEWLGDVSIAERILLVLAFLVLGALAAVGWLIFHLVQQHGRLLIRIEALEGDVRSSVPEAGLPIGTIAPTFSLVSLDGGSVTLEQLRQAGRPVALIFTDPECGPCTALMPEIGRWQHEHANAVTLALLSRGTVEANAAKAREHGLTNVLVQRDWEISEAYESLATPSAVLIRPNGTIGSRAALGAEAIRALITSATTKSMPTPLTIPNGGGLASAGSALRAGQPAPAMMWSNLSGETVSLQEFQGERTLVLFWNPGCGFCRRMLDGLKAWEADPPVGAPRLVVISTGSMEDNRAMGLRAPVLLDQGFVAGRAFGVLGTPSGVLLDNEGMIASEVAVGAPAVMKLASTKTERAGSAA